MPPEAVHPLPADGRRSIPSPGDIARAAYEAMPIAGFILDEAGHILFHTRRAARLFAARDGSHRSDLTGAHFEVLTHLDAEGIHAALRSCIAGGSITFPMQDPQRVDRHKDVVFHVSLMRVPGLNRQIFMLSQDHLRANVAALKNAHDLFDRESSRGLALEAHITELQRAVLSMETFAHAASHDLKTPINALSGLLDLFTDQFSRDLPEDARTYLDHMVRATQQLETLTTKLLTHAQSAAAPMDVSQVSVGPAIENALGLIDPGLRASAEAIDVRGPQFDVMAESTMFQILVGNLVTNALKHGGTNRALQVSMITCALENGGTLTVADNGTGFDPDQAHAIFAPFLRLNDGVQGSGLGLATCAEICRRHGWEIEAQSDGQSGAAFTVYFPAVLLR